MDKKDLRNNITKVILNFFDANDKYKNDAIVRFNVNMLVSKIMIEINKLIPQS